VKTEGQPHCLVAGLGNVFLGDDGFGVEVVRRLEGQPLPPGVRVADFGIRALHLAYELLEGRYQLTVLVDATPRGREPGTVYLLEPELGDLPATPAASAHGLTPEGVFSLLRTLGGEPARVLIVGCEPASVDEQMGLSEPVERAVDQAVALVRQVVGG
jgi:hydrogenase maturation protease